MAGPKWVNLSITGLMALAAVFALLAVSTAWAHDGDPAGRATAFGTDGVSDVRDGDKTTIALGNGGLDDFDGIGLARAGSVMAFVAAALFIASFLALENHLIAGHVWLSWVGIGAASAGTLVWTVALVLFPIGVSGLAESFNGGFMRPDLSWGAGLVFAILAAVCAITSLGVAVVHRAMTSGFRLELADAGAANFD